jgi:hypothetical protein
MPVIYAGAAWPLVPMSLFCGILLMAGFRYFSDQRAIASEKNKLQAHVLELRLYSGEPAVIWRTQLQLLRRSMRLIILLLRPAAVLSIPTIVLIAQLDAVYGRAPLRIGATCVVTAQMSAMTESIPLLETPPQFADDRPAVRIVGQNLIAWRLRPLHPFAGQLRIALGNSTIEKSVVAGEGPRYTSARRVRALFDYLLDPTESRLPEGPVRAIEIQYSPAEIQWLGLRLHWIVWFLLISTVSALASKRFLRVSL